jgi:uncharacterized protein YbjT (DUF2867 family)
MSSAPVVAHVAPNGWLGKTILPVFVDAAKNGDFAKLKIITSNESEVVKQAVAAATPSKVEVVVLKYEDKPALEAALKDVNVVISTMGGHGAQAANEQTLIETIAAVGTVKAYFNSDFGSDYDPETWGSSVFETKKAHRAAAEKLGIKAIGVAPGAFAQGVRSPFFGVNGADWEITGDGNYPFALTDMTDIGRYTARAAILAHNDPDKVPSRLRVYGESKTFNEYADIHEKITGEKVNKIYVPRDQVLEKWNSGKEGPFYVLRVASDSPAQNFVGRDHNELLNPGQKYFKPKTWEEIFGA